MRAIFSCRSEIFSIADLTTMPSCSARRLAFAATELELTATKRNGQEVSLPYFLD